MRFVEVKRAGRTAYNATLPDALLIYQPQSGEVRSLILPGSVHGWRESEPFVGEAPEEGWRHEVGCTCEFCSPAER